MIEKISNFEQDWKSFSELNCIEQNISNLGYKKEYIDKHPILELKQIYWKNLLTGIPNFREPLEVKTDGETIFWREKNGLVPSETPKSFATQFGVFINHNHGEFKSWLEKNDVIIDGNFCDMFDCGDYTYAISNVMHMGLGMFKIIRIDKEFDVRTSYDNYNGEFRSKLEYIGRFERNHSWYIIASGMVELTTTKSKQDKMIIFRIGENGDFKIDQEWNIKLEFVDSLAVIGDLVYFGQNKMISRLNMVSGQIDLFTNKSEEETSAMVEMSWSG